MHGLRDDMICRRRTGAAYCSVFDNGMSTPSPCPRAFRAGLSLSPCASRVEDSSCKAPKTNSEEQGNCQADVMVSPMGLSLPLSLTNVVRLVTRDQSQVEEGR